MPVEDQQKDSSNQLPLPRTSGRASNISRSDIDRHNEHMKNLKARKPNWALGAVFPSDEENRLNELNAQKDNNALNDAVDQIFFRGRELGYEMGSRGEKLPDQPEKPQQNLQLSNYENHDPKTTIGKEGGQVGGVINDVVDPNSAEEDDPGKTARPRPDPPRLKSGQATDSAQQDEYGEVGQIGGSLHNNNVDMEATQEKIEDKNQPNYNCWFRLREQFREPLAEFLGSCVFMIIGSGASMQTLVYTQSPTAAYSNLNWAFGIAVTTAVYVSGGISGGHINPALTFTLTVFRGFPWKLCLPYFVAQFLGKFCGSFIVYAMYFQAIKTADPNYTLSTAGLFVTLPSTQTTHVGLCVFQEIIATAVLMIAVLALGDKDNSPPGAGLGALILGLIIMAIGTSIGALSGYAMNPTRDFAPRVMLSIVGYGSKIWTHDRLWWLTGAILGTFAGALLGATVYDATVYTSLASPINFNGNQWKGALGLRIDKTHNMVRSALKKDRENRSKNESSTEKSYKQV